LNTLTIDPIFDDFDVRLYFQPRRIFVGKEEDLAAADFFDSFSSGHKIVLLAMVRLVETVSERTLVLIDEPETHLHPPLLSAFIRALSELLIEQNGVAIVATHSPVVLQELPRSSVWKLRRSGEAVSAERPNIETFGENVGVLTREVFGFEVARSGFHRMLEELVDRGYTLDEIASRFSGQLGSEAFGLLRVLISERNRQNGSPF
jgi:AAA domain, putative AbiEii toxin, Type IV TA system